MFSRLYRTANIHCSALFTAAYLFSAMLGASMQAASAREPKAPPNLNAATTSHVATSVTSPAASLLSVVRSAHTVTSTYLKAYAKFNSSGVAFPPGQTLLQATTTITLTSTTSVLTLGDTVTLTAVVSSSGAGTPTGSVTFFDGTIPLG